MDEGQESKQQACNNSRSSSSRTSPQILRFSSADFSSIIDVQRYVLSCLHVSLFFASHLTATHRLRLYSQI